MSIFSNNIMFCEWFTYKGISYGARPKARRPAFPFLFLIAAEALQVLILEACDKGLFNGISLNNDETNLSLLQYADDALIFGERSNKNIKNLVSIFKSFHEISGLVLTYQKVVSTTLVYV